MFSFFMEFLIYLFIIIFVYHLLSKKEINILEIIILLFIFNICILSLYIRTSILFTILLCLIIVISYYLYVYLYNISINKKIENNSKIFINRGIINFHELIKENYSYDKLILNLKKQGIDNPSLVDYCIKNRNDLVVFKKNSIVNYPISLIVDGNILKDNLFSINKTVEWLNNKIFDNNLSLKDINYAYFKNKQVYFITN